MARIRALKPDFFKDEDLATLPYEARLLYQGLWCYADKAGRLEYRPKYIKAEIFPYDNINIEKFLNLLATPNIPDRSDKVFIRIYTVNERKYIDIPEFSKHQSPHHTEKESVLPAFNGEITVINTLEKGNVRDAHYPKSINPKSINLNKEPKIKYLDSVFLTETQHNKLLTALGSTKLDLAISSLDYSITVKGKKYLDHYKTILNWNQRGFFNDNNQGFSTSQNRGFNKDRGLKPETEAELDRIAREYNEHQAKKAALCKAEKIPESNCG